MSACMTEELPVCSDAAEDWLSEPLPLCLVPKRDEGWDDDDDEDEDWDDEEDDEEYGDEEDEDEDYDEDEDEDWDDDEEDDDE